MMEKPIAMGAGRIGSLLNGGGKVGLGSAAILLWKWTRTDSLGVRAGSFSGWTGVWHFKALLFTAV